MNTPVVSNVLSEVQAEAVQHVLVVSVHTQHYALPLEVVDRVTWAVAITAVPDYADDVLGVVNVQGNVLPVISLRRRMGLPDRDVSLADRLVVTHFTGSRFALLVDAVEGVQDMTGVLTDQGPDVVPGVRTVEGVATRQGDILLICNMDSLLAGVEVE
jgi:purine-binding chemotaxis protein CheW